MTGMPSPEVLLESWRRNAPPPARMDDVRRLLQDEYRAYEIPVYSIMADDYANDEEVREELVDSLFTITHPDVLTRIYDAEARELHPTDPDEIEEYWRDLFEPHEDHMTFEYSLLITQHALGQRTSIMLEAEGQYATSFKVYGHSQPLIDHLTAVIGFPDRATAGADIGMDPGNLEDPTFVRYLEVLHRQGKLG